MPSARDFQRELTGMHVLIVGDPVGGFQIIGPFKTGEDAIRHGERECATWWIAPLEAPDA